jgi:hypothetical protein
MCLEARYDLSSRRRTEAAMIECRKYAERDSDDRVSVLTGLAERLWKQVLLLFDRYRVTSAESVFLRGDRDAAPSNADVAPVVLIEAVEDHYYLALFARVVARLAAEQPIRAEQLVSRSLRPGITRSLYHAAKSLCFYNALTDRKWIRLYATFCSAVAYRSAAPLISRSSIADLIGARRIWRSLRSKESLLDLTVAEIKVGDLIYDTYLRFAPAATIDLRSRYLWIVIWQTLRELRAARAYMSDRKPRMFITTFSTYIQHGVAARVALAAGVKVFTFGNFQEFYKQLHPTDLAHTRNPDNYRSGFAKLEDSAEKMVRAQRALAARLSGTIDVPMAYMRRSAYQSVTALPEGISGSLVLFLHDFFDSPHCYRWMIFPDFWDWATFTLDLARQSGIRVFAKPHPNQIVSSKSVVRQLTSKYPEVTWLSEDTSNVQLADAGMACAVTLYGSVAHEMAYLGVPSIAAGHNPHISYTFCHTARDRGEYSRLILNYRSLPRSPERLRQESLEFYCMHNLALTAEQASLREAVIRFRTLAINKGGWLHDGADFLAFMRDLDHQPAFHQACRELAAQLADDPRDLSDNSTAVYTAGSSQRLGNAAELMAR